MVTVFGELDIKLDATEGRARPDLLQGSGAGLRGQEHKGFELRPIVWFDRRRSHHLLEYLAGSVLRRLSRGQIFWGSDESWDISFGRGSGTFLLRLILETDLKQDHSLVGEPISVSPVAGGSLLSKRGELGEIDSVASRLGEVVGYQASIDGKKSQGSKKDFFVGTQVLEDIQNPTPTSVALKEGFVSLEPTKNVLA